MIDLKQYFPNRILVKGTGQVGSPIAIVGEFPDSKDEALQKPFAGGNGFMLKEILAGVGINVATCYFTHVLKERPWNNDKTLFLQVDKKSVKESDSYKIYREYLREELEMIKPNVVVAVGDFATYTLTGMISAKKYRGSVLECILVPGLKVIPILDPKIVFAKYIWKSYIQFDMRRVQKESEYPDIRRTQREYHLRPTFIQAMQYIKQCQSLDVVAFDIEVMNGEMSCISLAKSFQESMTIPFIAGGENCFTPDQELELMVEIGKILENPNIISLGQNVVFDATFLYRRYGIKSRNLHDTMVAMAICFPEFDKDLGFITSIYTDIPYYKDDGKNMFKNPQYDKEENFWLYCAKDSIVLAEAWPKQMKELERSGNLETYRYQIKLIEILLFMTEYGVKMDTDSMKEMEVEVSKQIQDLEKQLHEIVGFELNVNSPLQVKNYFYGTKKIKPYTKAGKPTVDEKALKQISAKGHVEAQIMLKMRERGKLASTYLRMKLDDDNRLRCSMNPVGTKFGRLSSSKTIFGTGANMQNQPRIMKKFMLIDEGHIGFNVDLSQAENRVVAYIAPEPKMIDAFETGKDIHRRTASYIFDIPENEVSDEKGSTDIGGGKYSQRDIGKRSNHSLNYGISANQFALIQEMQKREAEFIINKYHALYPGVRQMHEWIKNELQTTRSLTNLFGRRMTFRGRYDDIMFKAGYSFIPQSTVADKVNRHGLIPLYYDQDTYGDVIILNQVHDSIVFQIPINIGFEKICNILLSLKASLEQPLSFRGRDFVIPCDVEIAVGNFKNTKKLNQLTPTDIYNAVSELSTNVNVELHEDDYAIEEDENEEESYDF